MARLLLVLHGGRSKPGRDGAGADREPRKRAAAGRPGPARRGRPSANSDSAPSGSDWREAGRPAIVSFEAAEAAELVDRTLSQVRDLAFAIRPALLEDLGLVAAARSWVAYQARISGFSARFHADMLVDDPPPEIASACFRALQEAVTNVSRHAAASLVEVSLIASGNELVLTVRDDGVGFEPQITLRNPHQSLGLLGTAERIALVGGGMTIESTRVTGTTFRACFPRLSVEPTEADE